MSELYGEVTIRRGDNEDQYDLLEIGSIIYEGDHIVTAEDSGCILSILDMTTFEIKPESEIIITVPSGQDSKIDLLLGNIYTNVQKIITHGTMEVEMNQACAGIKGTTFVCEETGSKSTLKVLEGTALILWAAQSLALGLFGERTTAFVTSIRREEVSALMY